MPAAVDREIVNVGAEKKADALLVAGRQYRSWCVAGGRDASQDRRAGVWRAARSRWLIDDPKRAVANADWPKRLGRDRGGRNAAKRGCVASLLDPVTKRERQFGPFSDGQLNPVGVLADGAWLAWHYSARVPARLVRVALEADGPRILGAISVHPSASIPAPEELVAAEDFRWTSEDGLPIQGWLYRARVRSGVIGTILDIHGGPTAHGRGCLRDRPAIFRPCRLQCAADRITAARPASASSFRNRSSEGWGGAEQVDIRTGAEALIRAGIAARGKVGITGTSYGGYSSWWAITHFPTEIIAAAAPICGMTDLVVDYETTRPDIRPYSEEMMGGTPSAVPQRYFERSPINFIENVQRPAADRAGRQRSQRHAAECRRRCASASMLRARPTVLLVFDDEGHGIGRPANRKVLLKRLAAFLAEAFA